MTVVTHCKVNKLIEFRDPQLEPIGWLIGVRPEVLLARVTKLSFVLALMTQLFSRMFFTKFEFVISTSSTEL